MSRLATLSILAVTAGAGCADDHDPSPSLEPVIAEACLHAQHGPYRDQPASADLLGTVSDVDRPHTAYRIALPAAGTGYLGAVVYTPRHDARYAFVLDREPVLDLRDRDDQAVAVDRTAVTGCPVLSHVVTADLAAGTPYRLVLGPDAAPDVMLVIENVDELVP